MFHSLKPWSQKPWALGPEGDGSVSKCLLCKHEDLSSIPRKHVKNKQTGTEKQLYVSVTPGLRSWRQARQSSQICELQVVRDPFSNTKQTNKQTAWNVIEEDTTRPLSPTHVYSATQHTFVYTHMHMNTCIRTCTHTHARASL